MDISRIYTLSHPITGEIRYIGKTRQTLNRRLTGHIVGCRHFKSHCINWIKGLERENIYPVIQLIEECASELDCEREKYWIKKYLDGGYRLLNMTEGGDGLPLGYKQSKETSEKKSIANIIRYERDYGKKIKRARELRYLGWSINQIGKELDLTRQWAWKHVKDIELSENQKQKLNENKLKNLRYQNALSS